jgi:hypothetical protein
MRGIGTLTIYYNNQLKKRKLKKKGGEKGGLLFNNLRSQILLRKSYVSNRFIDNLHIRRSLSNINSYHSTICVIRNTKLYIGFPRHIFSFLFTDRYVRKRQF